MCSIFHIPGSFKTKYEKCVTMVTLKLHIKISLPTTISKLELIVLMFSDMLMFTKAGIMSNKHTELSVNTMLGML